MSHSGEQLRATGGPALRTARIVRAGKITSRYIPKGLVILSALTIRAPAEGRRSIRGSPLFASVSLFLL
jgi:hypothetical protein